MTDFHITKKGFIFDKDYSYEGELFLKEELPHGNGTFYYSNGDEYTGEIKCGKPDGFGQLKTKTENSYIIHTGYFNMGKMNGIGTLDCDTAIRKGNWRNGMKHGDFIKTNKNNQTTYKEFWLKNKLIKSVVIQYRPPETLQTTKRNPKFIKKTNNIYYKGKDKKCAACCEKFTNATNTKCGHIVMCYECLLKCDKCPICRCNIEKIIKLFIA